MRSFAGYLLAVLAAADPSGAFSEKGADGY
jgi:hypothetical protein